MIEIIQLSKSYGDEKVLDSLRLTHEKHKTLSILGESGSGKSTLLKVIAGLEEADNGDVQIDGSSIMHLPPKKRGTVYLYQEPLLFPHLSVLDNIGFGLRFKNMKADEIEGRSRRLIEELKLSGQEEKYPHELSGGQKQRVAFGRAVIIHPSVLLLDEPFASLDPGTRREMQHLFREIAEAEKITSLFVTHDIREALTTGDRFGMMIDGKLKIFETRDAFIKDSETGVKDEIDFWKNLK